MTGSNLTRPQRRLRIAPLLTLWAVIGLTAHHLAQAGSECQNVLRVPAFIEAEWSAQPNVAVPLGPDLTPVLSQISVEVRGSGSFTESCSGGLLAVGLEGQEPVEGRLQVADGQTLDVDAFFDITYRIDFIDTDPQNDFAPGFLTGPGRVSLRTPRQQRSRLEGSYTCIADTSAPNNGCVPQIADKDGINFEDISYSLGSGVVLNVPERNLAATFIEQVPLAGNQIFADGFESGNTSAWSVSSAPPGSLQLKTSSFFSVELAGSIEIQEKVVVPGALLANHFSLIGAGAASNTGFQTTMIFTNTGGESDLQVEFFDSQGEPLEVDLGEASPGEVSVFNTTLARGQALSVQIAGQDGLQVGYARFRASPSVGATAVFSLSNTSSGASLYDAGVPSVTRPLRRFSIFLDSLGNRDTGLVMVRTQQDPIGPMEPAGRGAQQPESNLRLLLFDTDFNPLAETEFPLTPGAQISRFIYEFFADQPAVAAQAREMQGVVVVESDALVAALTLRLVDDPVNPTLTAFPVIEGRAEPAVIEALRR